jgi:DNA adenine methylase
MNLPFARATSQYGIPPLFRWAGSKRQLLSELMRHVPSTYRGYIEPFSGSACLFFALRPSIAILSDLNYELIHAYSVLRTHPTLLYRAVAGMPLSKRHYYSLRGKKPDGLDDLARAARFVYLNRCCFNGVYRLNQDGLFNVPRGKRPGAIPEHSHFIKCANALRRATLSAGDFELTVSRAEAGDFVYLDPPYAKSGSRRRGEYGYLSFDVGDIDRLGRCLKDLDKKNATFLLSYADSAEIRAVSSKWYQRTILVRRHVAGFQQHRAIVREILVSNREFNISPVPIPHSTPLNASGPRMHRAASREHPN